MAGITFSEAEVKKLILALAGSKAAVVEEPEIEDSEDKSEEKPEVEKAEVKPEESAGKPFKESTKDMLKRKLEEKDA